MIRLQNLSLPTPARTKLKEWQGEVDAIAEYADRVAAAKDLFTRRNRTDNPAFRIVRQMLREMCLGVCRCVYCEDSMADEVEHLKPKDLYPEVVFVWENYIYICGPCNGRKNNKFAVFIIATGQLTDVTRKPGAPVVPPELGALVFIDPRRDDGLRMMELELQTGWFFPLGAKQSKKYQRAKFTIETLGLNRDLLCTARVGAYRHYRAHLSQYQYIKKRDEGASPQELDDLVHFVKGMEHATVWAEMKRQHQLLPDLRQLFTLTPEALNW